MSAQWARRKKKERGNERNVGGSEKVLLKVGLERREKRRWRIMGLYVSKGSKNIEEEMVGKEQMNSRVRVGGEEEERHRVVEDGGNTEEFRKFKYLEYVLQMNGEEAQMKDRMKTAMAVMEQV
ncbi:hypothetical protein KM043_017039 [Ampulex compressa]|nr:hypothetical protein KM043_017039 [Ampulex compressa]